MLDGRDAELLDTAHGGDQDAMQDFSPFGRANRFSVHQAFAGRTVFVTGGTGFIGSLVIELLLRTTDVARIYVLGRGKRGAPARERVQRMLHSGLFHLVRDSPETLAKVHVMEGDMTLEDLGLSAEAQGVLSSEVEIILHAASIIELEADVQRTLYGNYIGTRRLLALASRMPQLRAMVCLSTAHANVNLPPGSSVDEVIYPLYFGNQEVDHASLVDDLLSLTPESANVRAQMYLDMWNFPNTYTLGKNLTEKLVAQFHANGLPVAIVRPSLVCGLAGGPYPGYSASLAGPGGAALSQAIGLFDTLNALALNPTNVWDVVPADQVAAVVVAAAAATAARVHIDGYGADSVALGSAVLGSGSCAGNGLGGPAFPGNAASGPLIVHAATSTTYPISFVESQWAALSFIAQNPPPFRLPGGELFRVPLDFKPNADAVAKAKRTTAWKVWFAVKVLEALGQHKTARRLKWGHIAWDAHNSAKTDRNIFYTTKNLLALEQQLEPSEADEYMTVWTLRHGGWPRYIATTLAGMYRQVFGVTRVDGVDHDFMFIPSREPPLLRRRRGKSAKSGLTAAAAAIAGAVADGTSGGDGGSTERDALLGDAAAAAGGADAGGGADEAGGRPAGMGHARALSSVREEDGAFPSADDYASDEDLERDPMAATRQAVLASCATVPACGTVAGAAAGGAGGVAAAPSGAGLAALARVEAEFAASAAAGASAAPVHDARGVLRVAAVALGRTLSYRPSVQLSTNLELVGLALGGTPAGSATANGSGLDAAAVAAAVASGGSASSVGPRPSLGALTKSASLRQRTSAAVSPGAARGTQSVAVPGKGGALASPSRFSAQQQQQ